MTDRWTGLFVSFEGLDGAGKSTQVAALGAALRAAHRPVISVRPSDTELGDMAHSFLLTHRADIPLDAWSEALLFIASRAQLLRETILPALHSGKVVVADRWADSTLAYQGGGRGLSLDALRSLHRDAVDDVWPDLTLYLDLPLRTAMQRQRAAQLPLDRFEQGPEAFHAAVEATFRSLVAAEPQRFVTVDASGPATAVSRVIWEAVCDRLGDRPAAQDRHSEAVASTS